MREIWKKLKSLRLAVFLIVLLTAGSVMATLIPQGLESQKYFDVYPKLVATLVVELGLGRYFTSLLFLLPAIAFFVNLLACTVDRLARELRKKARRRHGPDVLHVGLLLLIIGSLISFSERKEGSVSLRVGDSVDLPNGERLTLKEFRDERYADGRPREWTSVVDISKGAAVTRAGAAIRVNTPLSVADMTIYQASYGAEYELEMTDAAGSVQRLGRGETKKIGAADYFFMTIDSDKKAVVRVTGVPDFSVVRVDEKGTEIGPMRAVLKTAPTTGLHAVTDPGYPVVLAALVLVGLGTALTFVQKSKEAA
jgi:cytochrome c biogenesis protein ResB